MSRKIDFNVEDGVDDMVAENYADGLIKLSKVLSFFDTELLKRGMEDDVSRNNLVHTMLIYLLEDNFLISNVEDDNDEYFETE